MIRSVVNRLLKVVLSELFLNVTEEDIHVSIGADLFTEGKFSKLAFNNLTIRPDILDVHLQPLKLVSGHIGKLNIDGFAELAFGGSVKCQVENLFLLFEVDTELDAQRAQFLRKMLVEMASNGIQYQMMRELVKQIQGFNNGKDPDIRKKRSLMIKSLKYFFNSVQFTASNIHVRIEFRNQDGDLNALGMTIPTIQLMPSSRPPEGLSKSDPALSLIMKSVHIYADYETTSYRENGDAPEIVFAQFSKKWKSEPHIALLFPLDVELIVGVEIQRRNGLFLPKLQLIVPGLHFVCDPRQLQLVQQLLEQVVQANIRIRQLLRVRVAFTRDELPRVYSTGGSHILPQLSSGQNVYPANMGIPSGLGGGGLVALLKVKMGAKWRKALWKHLTRLVLEDVRATMPLGHWTKVAQMAFARKDYALSYSKVLKKSSATGNYVYDVNGNFDPELLRRLFEYEMRLPVAAITRFRALAHMVALVGTINSKRLEMKNARASNPQQPLANYERVNIGWNHLVYIQAELYEALQESAFKSFSKRSSSAGIAKDIGGDDDDVDDNASVTSSNSARSNTSFSVTQGSSSLMGSSVNPVRTSTNLSTPGNGTTTNGSASNNRNSMSSTFSLFSRTPGASNSAAGAGSSSTSSSGSSMLQQTMRIISAVKQAATLPTADELDSKLFGRSEISAFGDIVGKAEPESKATVFCPRYDKAAAQQALAKAENVTYDRLDTRLAMDPPPTAAVISAAVNWVMLRNQPPLTIVPPDLHIRIQSTHLLLRGPMMLNGSREDILKLKFGAFTADLLIISPSFNEQPPAHLSTPSKPPPPTQRTIFPSFTPAPATPTRPTPSRGTNSDSMSTVGGTLTSLFMGPTPVHAPSGSMSVPSVVDGATGSATSTPGGEVGVVRSLQGFASLVGSLIQTKASLASFTVDVHVKDRELMAAMDGSNVEDDIISAPTPRSDGSNKALRGEGGNGERRNSSGSLDGVVESEGDRVLSYLRVNEDHVRDSLGLTEGPVTILHALQVGEQEEQTRRERNRKPQDVCILRNVASAGENFATLCVMLDLDEASEGAADIQLQFSEVQANLSGAILSRVMDDRTQAIAAQAAAALDALYGTMGLAEETAYVIDHEARMSSAVISFYGVARVDQESRSPVCPQRSNQSSTNVSNNAANNEVSPFVTDVDVDVDTSQHSGDTATQLLQYFASEPISNSTTGQNHQESSRPRTSAAVRNRASVRRQAIIDNLNFTKWHIIARRYVPTALTVCIKSGKLSANFLAACTLRNLMGAVVKRYADNASKRSVERHRESLQGLKKAMGAVSVLLEMLLSTRDANLRDKEGFHEEEKEEHASFTITPWETSMFKTQVPAPRIDLKMFGIELRLPVNDETLCQALATFLGAYVPFYR